MTFSPFIRLLTGLLAADILLSFVYAAVPADIELARQLLAWVQLAAMTVTMAIAVRRVLLDY
jgi:hypothetical protein